IRIRSVNRVLLDRFAEILANRSGIRFRGIGRAHHFAQMRHGVIALERGHEDRTRRHVIDKRFEERPLAMYGVKTFGLFLRETDLLEPEEAKTFALESRD